MNAFGFVLDDASLRRAAVEGVPETVIAAIYLLHERGVGEVAAKLTRRRARRLIKEKGELRNVELAAGERPFERLREGDRKASRRAPSIWTFCEILGEFIRTFAQSPTRFLKPPASSRHQQRRNPNRRLRQSHIRKNGCS